MFLLKLYRYIGGYVEFNASGGFIERFLNLCNINGIVLWDITINGGVLNAFTDIKTYKKLHTFARKTGCIVKVKKKNGLPFFNRRHKSRIGLLAGMAAFAVVIALCTSFIWSVEVEGNKNIRSDEILSYLADEGLKKGVRAHSVDTSVLENKAMSDFEGIAWIGINIYGTKAVVELRESVEVPKRIEKERPCNIKADMDALVLKMKVYEGFSAVHEGDSVVAGDLLVSAVSESAVTGNTFYKHANADIVGRTTHTLTVNVPKNETLREYTGEVKSRNYITFFIFKIPLYIGGEPKGNYEIKKSDKNLVLWGTALPLEFHKREYKEYSEKQRSRTVPEMEKLAEEQLQKNIKRVKGLVKIENQNIVCTPSEQGISAVGTFTLQQYIGKEEYLSIENSSEEE